jgi:predicted O-methyltransferase YrrM
LFWLAKNAYEGQGIIVDAGLFLGASTNAFAAGIKAGGALVGAADFKPINCYDTAVWVKGMDRHLRTKAVERALNGLTIRHGQSLLPVLQNLLAPHLDLIDLRIGDIVETATADRPIEIAFYDCLKTAERDAAAFKAFAPWYIPGKTIIVQQDYFYESAPDLKIRQEYLAPYFSYLGAEATSAVFRLDRPLPEAYLREDPVEALSVDDKVALLSQAADRARDPKFQLYGRLAVVQFLADVGERDRALTRLMEILGSLGGHTPDNFGERMSNLVAALRARLEPDPVPQPPVHDSARLMPRPEAALASKFDTVTQTLGPLKFMDEKRAGIVRDLIHECDARNLLELGFYHGKSSAYLAAILEDRGGAGHLTTIDLERIKTLAPGIQTNLEAVGIAHRVTPIFTRRSYTWEMARLLKQTPRPQFDFCYFDGGHTWDLTGFGILLVDMLLRPGGIIVIDDLNWTIARSINNNPQAAKVYARYDEDEKTAKGVRLVWDTIIPHLGYAREQLRSLPWGVARKPKR